MYWSMNVMAYFISEYSNSSRFTKGVRSSVVGQLGLLT